MLFFFPVSKSVRSLQAVRSLPIIFQTSLSVWVSNLTRLHLHTSTVCLFVNPSPAELALARAANDLNIEESEELGRILR